MAAACGSFLQATDVADYLVARGVPFREAHHLTGTLVRECLERGVGLGDLPLEDLRRLSPAFDDGVIGALDARASLARKALAGGSAPEWVREQLARAAALLGTSDP
jgi:argininosuccinate lyase